MTDQTSAVSVPDLAAENKRLTKERDIYKRAFEFLESMADGAAITVNGRPWRAVYQGLQRIVPDGLPLPPVPDIEFSDDNERPTP